MTSVSFNSLCAVALTNYKDAMKSAHLDDDNLARLTRACNRRKDALDTSKWGSLQPMEHSVETTCSMIDWAAETVAWFWKMRHLGSPLTQAKCVYMSSQYVSHLLSAHAKAGKPERFPIPNTGFMQMDSLAAFVTRTNGEKKLSDVPFWEKIAFVINGKSHWSVLVYIRSMESLVHYDSSSGVHKDLMWDVADMLYATGLVDRSVEVITVDNQAQQKGGWECGYAVIARLYELGLSSSEIPAPELSPTSADDIISSEMPLFLNYLLLRNEQAKNMDVFIKRLARY